MKKLPITKESFEKSKYFTNKYGKLEYVSESGKLFKTEKGNILKFKESIKDIAPGIQDWGSTIYVEPLEVEMSWDDVYYIVKKDCRQYPLLEKELGLEPHEEPSDEQIREWIETNPKSFMDYLEEFGSYNATDFSGDDEYDESTKKFGKKFTKESDEWDDAIFKPSNELQKLYKELKAKYEKGDIEIRLADMMFGKFWLVVEVPEDDVKTLDKMEKILKSKCEGNENWEVFREEHLYGDVSKVAIQENPSKKDKDDKKRPVSKPKPPFLGIKGTQDHGTFIMYRNAAIEKDELFQGIQAMLDDEGIDASAEDWASDPKNKRVVRDFLVDYARFAND